MALQIINHVGISLVFNGSLDSSDWDYRLNYGCFYDFDGFWSLGFRLVLLMFTGCWVKDWWVRI
jgi:hypothetical protein